MTKPCEHAEVDVVKESSPKDGWVYRKAKCRDCRKVLYSASPVAT